MQTETQNLPVSVLVKSQIKTFGWKSFFEQATHFRIKSEVRHDDQCGNGQNSFSVTAKIQRKDGRGAWKDHAGGCCHKEIAKHFPELAPLIKWHLTSTDGPMHYIANTVYHVLEHGPKKAWVYFDDPANGIKKECVKYCDLEKAHEMCLIPSKTFNYVSGVGYRLEKDMKTAKERNLDHARACAVWPDATVNHLTAPGLETRLMERFPSLMAEFKAAVESLGLTY
jgi:hypothetical protein